MFGIGDDDAQAADAPVADDAVDATEEAVEAPAEAAAEPEVAAEEEEGETAV